MKIKVAIVTALFVFSAAKAEAFDFGIPVGSGDSLFFNITSPKTKTVEVVYPSVNGINYYYGHKQPSGVLDIPATVSDGRTTYKVTAIGDRAFSGCAKLTHVVIPNSVQKIGAYAFYGCSGIKGRLTIGPEVASIGASAFYGCGAVSEVEFLAKRCTFMGGSISTTVFGNCRGLRRIIFGPSVESIPDYAFSGSEALSDSLSLPKSLRSIGAYAFAYCSKLSGNLTLPDNLETLGECAFHQCHSLRHLVLGSSLKRVGGRAFYHCVGLRQVRIKSIAPPEIVATTFADISKGVKVLVPCVSKSLYANSGFWNKVGSIESYGSCTVSIVGAMQDPHSGIVVGGGEYAYGDSVTLYAVCASGFGFTSWSDGSKDNPRRIAAVDNHTFTAVTIPSGIVTVVDTLEIVDTVFSDGVKIIRDTVDLIDAAQSVNSVKEVSYDPYSKKVTWTLQRKEKALEVSLFNPAGDRVYLGKGNINSLNMRRYPTGSYILRIETTRRILRCRIFIK